jgi:hypothetical protein
MKNRAKGVIALGAALLLGVSAIAQQQSPTAKPQQPTNKMMSMDDMMKGCREHCEKTMSSIDQTNSTMEQAKQSNDPAQMRAAIEQGQKSLAEMKEHMSMCMSMMDMMQKKQGSKRKGE